MECYINDDLDLQSDYEMIKMAVKRRDMSLDQEKESKFQLQRIDKKRFTEKLLAEKDLIQAKLKLAGQEHQGKFLTRRISLDKCAEAVIEALYKSLKLNTP